jgi:hypothetical protein
VVPFREQTRFSFKDDKVVEALLKAEVEKSVLLTYLDEQVNAHVKNLQLNLSTSMKYKLEEKDFELELKDKELELKDKDLELMDRKMMRLRDMYMRALVAGTDCTAPAVFEYVQCVLAWSPNQKWGATQWQMLIERNYFGMKDCMKQLLPNVPVGKYGSVMTEAYRRMCESVHRRFEVIDSRDQGLYVTIVPARLNYIHNTQLPKPPPKIIQSIDGDSMAEVLAWLYEKMEFRVEIVRSD